MRGAALFFPGDIPGKTGVKSRWGAAKQLRLRRGYGKIASMLAACNRLQARQKMQYRK